MERNKKLLLALGGQPIDQVEPILEMEDGYECWNLKKFTIDTFIDALKSRIPPVNDNVLRNYKVESDRQDIFGVTEAKFNKSSWGLLIPESLEDAIANHCPETLFLINLYSPQFLYPVFYGSDFGIMRPWPDEPVLAIAHNQDQSRIFKTRKFVAFFKAMLPQSQYGTWQSDRAQNWEKEDWRLFVAAMLFSGLKEYDNKKHAFGWQRESADMAAILESLFTSGDIQTEEVGYRLRKRIAVLLSHRFPNVEEDIKELYRQRSTFVHGSFFSQIARKSKLSPGNLPVPDFDLLYKQKEYVRWALVAYLHLAQRGEQESHSGDEEKPIHILEKSIIDTAMRESMLARAEEVLSLLPEPSS